MSSNPVIEKPEKVSPEVVEAASKSAWDIVASIVESLFNSGPAGLAIVVLIMTIGFMGYIILQQTKTILSIRQMTTETDKQVADALISIGSQLSNIQFILTHSANIKGDGK